MSSRDIEDTLSVVDTDMEFAGRLFKAVYHISLQDEGLFNPSLHNQVNDKWPRISNMLQEECASRFPSGVIDLRLPSEVATLLESVVSTAEAAAQHGIFTAKLTANRAHSVAKGLKSEYLAPTFKEILNSVRKGLPEETLPDHVLQALDRSIRTLYSADETCGLTVEYQARKKAVLSDLFPLWFSFTVDILSDKVGRPLSPESDEFRAFIGTTKAISAYLEATQRIIEFSIPSGRFRGDVLNPATRDAQWQAAISNEINEFRQHAGVRPEVSNEAFDDWIYNERMRAQEEARQNPGASGA